MTAKMIIDTLKIVTTAFIIFTGGYFFTAFCKAQKGDRAVNAICSLFMVLATVFMWLGRW